MARPAGSNAAKVKVSVIVPAHLLDDHLTRCLRSLEALDFPRDAHEVLVVTDGVEAGRFFEDFHVRHLTAPKGGPARARNLGISQARGELVAFTDSDCLVRQDWLTELLRCLDDPRVAGAGGAQLSPPDEGPFGRTVQRFFTAISFIGGYTREHAELRPVDHNPSCNSIYRKQVLEQVGGFDESLFPGEDLDLDLRLTAKGWQLLYNPAAAVYHFRPTGLFGFARMMERYGRFSGGIMTRRHGFFRKICYEPAALVLLLSATLALCLLNPMAGAAWILGLLLALLLFFRHKTGSVAEGLACTALLFTTLASWNLGFARGFFFPPANVTAPAPAAA